MKTRTDYVIKSIEISDDILGQLKEKMFKGGWTAS